MDIKKLRKNSGMRVKTDAGLDIRLFNESLEVELDRMPFGLELELVDARNASGATAPPGAYYRINFYELTPITGKSGKVGEGSPMKSMLPGAIYLSREGVLIRGCTPVSGTNQAVIDYKDRL